MKSVCKVLSLFMASMFFLIAGNSKAQDYPVKPIKLIVGYTPGGNLDMIARVVGQGLSKQLGQPVIVENKPGADARIATEYVAKSAPDGYTLLVGATGQMVFNPGLYPSLAYDPVKDFVPITLLGSTPLIFAANPKKGPKSIKDLIARAKAKPGETFYSTGATPFYASAELFKKLTGANIVNVPFKGNVQAVNAAMAGDVPVVVADLPTALAQVKGGKLRALAITGSQRIKFLPDTPTMMELGVNFQSKSWTGLFAPAGTPQAVIDKLYGALSIILQSEDMKEELSNIKFDVTGVGMPPAEFGAMHRADLAKWTKVLKDLNIHAE